MILNRIKCICAALVLMTANASATLITFETKDLAHNGSASGHNVDQNDFAGSWSAIAGGVSENFLGDFTNVQSGNDKFNHVQIDLSLERDNANWVFDFGLDAGLGMALYLDGSLVKSTSDDLWWATNWNNSDVFSVELNDLNRDNKVIDIYWAEHCCSGVNSIRFKNDAGQINALSVANVDAASIPEPTSIALFGLALLAFVTRRAK